MQATVIIKAFVPKRARSHTAWSKYDLIAVRIEPMFNVFGPKVPQVDAEVVKKAIDDKEDMVIIDVRTDMEYSKGKIPGSINIPLDQIPQLIEKLYPDKSKKYYVHCLSGSRSVQAVDMMVKLGYTNVFDMKSGLLAWRVKKYPTI